MHEIQEEAIVKEVFEQPVVVETVEKTVVLKEGELEAEELQARKSTGTAEFISTELNASNTSSAGTSAQFIEKDSKFIEKDSKLMEKPAGLGEKLVEGAKKIGEKVVDTVEGNKTNKKSSVKARGKK
jgi:hypothetical protein